MNTSDLLTAVVDATPAGAQLQDAVVGDGYAGTRWTNNSLTGLTLHRVEDALIVQSWSAARTVDVGPWPDQGQPFDLLNTVTDHSQRDSADARGTIDLYFQVRVEQARADELRPMFAEPMVVHGSGATRIENLDDFIERVRREPQDTPDLKFRPHDLLSAGNRVFLRWTYLNGNAVAAAGLTLYAFDGPVITERWQASLPPGVGWS